MTSPSSVPTNRFIPALRVTLTAALFLSACKNDVAPRIVGSLTAAPTFLPSQTALGGTAVAAVPAVTVLDQDGEPLAGTPVTFVVTAGGGAVAGSPAVSDAAGVARVSSWTLGTTGGDNVVRATASGLSVDFHATSLVAATLEVTSSASQVATVGTAVPSVPAVRVIDQLGHPLVGATVTFQVASGAGTLGRTQATTDANGVATAGSWTLGTVVGANSVAAAAGSATATFTATGTVGAAARLALVSGSQQSGTVHTALAQPFVARVTDQYGNVVQGTSVSMNVTAGQATGATVAPASASSGADGTVSAVLTLGDSAGPHEVTMSFAGVNVPLVFTATADWRRLRAASVSGTDRHACATGLDGKAYCWGAGTNGQIGDGAGADRAIATRVGADVNLVSVVAGSRLSCGLDAAGNAYCWGDDDGTPPTHLTPVAVTGGLSYRSLSVGDMTACGLTATDAAYCWTGYSSPVAVPGGLSFRSISVASQHTCGVTTTGVVYCWGNNANGAIGTGDTTQHAVTTPTAIASSGRTFTTVVVGEYTTCALDPAGAAYCWGANPYGQLGIPLSTTMSATPVAVSGGLRFTALFGAIGRFCGVVSGTETDCWGYIPPGLAANSTNPVVSYHDAPVVVPALAGWTSVSGQDNWFCGVLSGDAVCMWYGEHGVLGDGVLTSHFATTATKVRAP